MRFRRAAVSAFIALNLIAVIAVNSGSVVAPGLRAARDLLVGYARLVGLDERCTFFSMPERHHWWPTYWGIYRGARRVFLSVPSQTRRDFWQWHFFDFKEVVLAWQLYSDPETGGWKGYANYLCRRFSVSEGRPIQSVQIEFYLRRILAPREVGPDPGIESYPAWVYPCGEGA